MQRVVPTLRITDYEKSKAFYTEGLGFVIEWEHRFEPHFPVFMSIARDGMRIFLSQHTGDCQVGGLVHFYITSVHELNEELRRKDVPIAEAPTNDLGFWMLTIVDPDGNQLRFCESREK